MCQDSITGIVIFSNYRTGNGKKCADSITGIEIGKLTIPVMF
jgi:hypothetical protein